jgi:hypothetical protein
MPKALKPIPSALLGVVAKQKRTARYQICHNFIEKSCNFPPCVVFATIIPIAALGVFTKRIRRSEWRFALLGDNAKQGVLAWFERYWHRLGRPRKAEL